jgi:hypothetical protein
MSAAAATTTNTPWTASSVLNLGQSLAQENTDIQTLENIVVQANAVNLTGGSTFDAELASLSSDVQAIRAQHNKYADMYITAYRSIFGNVPSGLMQSPAQIAVYAGVFVTVAYGLYVVGQLVAAAKIKAEAYLQNSKNTAVISAQCAHLDQQAADALAAGDTVTAAAAQQQAATCRQAAADMQGSGSGAGGGGGSSSDPLTWLANNWQIAAVVAGGIFLLKKL